MEKKIINAYIGELDLEELDGLTCQQAGEYFLKLIEQYGDYTALTINYTFYDTGQELELYGKREETDREYADRLKMEAQAARKITLKEEKERRQYEKLKAKYG